MRRRSGFTLIEMMIVLAIIAALAATLVPIAMNALNQARITGNLTDLSSIRAAEMQYFSKEKTLTASTADTKSGLGIYLNFNSLQKENISGDYVLTVVGDYLEVEIEFENSNLANAFLAQWTDVKDQSIPVLPATIKTDRPTDDTTGYQQYADFSTAADDSIVYVYYGFK